MWRVTGINLLTCVNWAALAERHPRGAEGVERIFIYYMFAVIKSCGRLICRAPDGSISPLRRGRTALSPLRVTWPVKESNKLASVVEPKVPSMRRRSAEPKAWWESGRRTRESSGSPDWINPSEEAPSQNGVAGRPARSGGRGGQVPGPRYFGGPSFACEVMLLLGRPLLRFHLTSVRFWVTLGMSWAGFRRSIHLELIHTYLTMLLNS